MERNNAGKDDSAEGSILPGSWGQKQQQHYLLPQLNYLLMLLLQSRGGNRESTSPGAGPQTQAVLQQEATGETKTNSLVIRENEDDAIRLNQSTQHQHAGNIKP